MAQYLNILVKTFGFIACITVYLSTNLFAQNSNVYVWDFKTSEPAIKKFASKFTDDFETELIKLDKYTVLQRRNHNLVLAHRDMESEISNVKNLPTETVDQLKNLRAETVIFGQLIDDVDGHVYEVSVFFQNLENGEIPKKESIIIEKTSINNNSARKRYMKDLITKLHFKEILEAKNEQFRIISKKLDTYIVKAKDVHIAFRDIIDIALKNEAYFEELETIINAYNNIFIDWNDNGENYLLSFESVWGSNYGRELQSIYDDMINDIHKKHILKLNNVRKKILDYRANQNKRERERLKEDIIWNSKNSSIGLNTAIDNFEDQIQRFYFNLKEDLRTKP
ncbi:hypothetical protein ABI125_07170 [Tamlana crocina]